GRALHDDVDAAGLSDQLRADKPRAIRKKGDAPLSVVSAEAFLNTAERGSLRNVQSAFPWWRNGAIRQTARKRSGRRLFSNKGTEVLIAFRKSYSFQRFNTLNVWIKNERFSVSVQPT